ncbi:hypothetical protein ACFX14_040632 [Malus domestica]
MCRWKELEDTVRAKLPNAKLGQGYGMTEAGPVLSMCLAFANEPFEMKSGACGTVVRNAEMKIVDPDMGASLPRNQAGKICIRGSQIMKGYLNDPKATERTVDNRGWLHTGDIGYIDGDDELFIVDRLKELIKYKGFQVAPAELEAMLIAHPNISDAAAIPSDPNHQVEQRSTITAAPPLVQVTISSAYAVRNDQPAVNSVHSPNSVGSNHADWQGSYAILAGNVVS